MRERTTTEERQMGSGAGRKAGRRPRREAARNPGGRVAEHALKELSAALSRYEPGSEARKLSLLRLLEQGLLASPPQVLRLHEALCFLRAYPDGPELLSLVERMLEGFSARRDLKRHRRALADSGIAGTELHTIFFWPTARWLARRHPLALRVDWREFESRERLQARLPLLVHFGETPGLDETPLSLPEWCNLLRGPGEADGAFLARRFAALPMSDEAREVLYQDMQIPLVLASAPETPARGREKFALPISYQRTPPSRERPDLGRRLRARPPEFRVLAPGEARRMIDLARGSMVTRLRDLDVFAYADPRDVRLADCGNGLQFAVIGAVPSRRLLLESVYGLLTCKNGVPVGYVLLSALFGSSEVAFNVFETFRGTEASAIYGSVLAVTRALFGSDSFTVFPYQLGYDTEEGLRSGAWWFYQKLGFLPRDRDALALMREELRRMREDPAHRSSRPVLKRLAAEPVFFHLGRRREDVLGIVPFGNVGLRISRFLAERFGSDRERGERVCRSEAMRLLGLRSLAGYTVGERLAFDRWSPLLCLLPGLARWTGEERSALVRIIRAKGGVRESDFVLLGNRHRALQRGVRSLAAAG